MGRRPTNRDRDGYAYSGRLDSPPKRKRVWSTTTKNSRNVNVRVPLDLFAKLQEGAQRARCTMSDIVVAALTVALLPHDTEEGGTEDA